jgi:hypothetical protein
MEQSSYNATVSELPENGLGVQTGETNVTRVNSGRKDS